MFDRLTADTRRLRESSTKAFPWYVLEALAFNNGYQAVVLYRLASWFKHRRVPLLGPFISRLALFLTGVDISPSARFGPGLLISHGVGIVVGGAVEAGSGTVLLHQVTLGGSRRRDEMPKLGDNVFVGVGARLLGGITIGDSVFIGANAVVTRDIPENSKVISAPHLSVSTLEGDESRAWVA